MRAHVLSGVAVLVCAFGVVAPARLEAHATRSVSVEIVELGPGSALLHVRKQLPEDAVDVDVDVPCRLQALEDGLSADRLQRTTRIVCPGAVAGATLRFAGLGPILTEAIVLYSFSDGRTGSTVVRADEPTVTLPTVTTRLDVARGYLASGVAHILEGYDHLLFLLLIVFSLRTVTSVLLAETAFTLSHSLSFSATALGWVHVSSSAAEACIALSLVLMALDIRAGVAGPRLRGAALAFVFGLVHGLGFAGALREIGVPDRDVAVALLGFAGGVELGQVLFLACALSAMHALSRAPGALMQRLEPVAIALAGGISTYWFMERLVSLVITRT
jgi:hydrogenase/urease accessory protein HupE